MPREISKAIRSSKPGDTVTPTVNITSDSISVSGFDDSVDWTVTAGVLKQNGVVIYRFQQQGEVAVDRGQYVHDVEGTMNGPGYMSNTIEYNFTNRTR